MVITEDQSQIFPRMCENSLNTFGIRKLYNFSKNITENFCIASSLLGLPEFFQKKRGRNFLIFNTLYFSECVSKKTLFHVYFS